MTLDFDAVALRRHFVICFQISIFAISETTLCGKIICVRQL